MSDPPSVTYDRNSDTFTGTTLLIVKLAMRAVQELGWKLVNANEVLGFVTFETGMSWGSFAGVSCSLNIEEISANRFRVIATGRQNNPGGKLVLNIGGEAQKRADKALRKMAELAARRPAGSAPMRTAEEAVVEQEVQERLATERGEEDERRAAQQRRWEAESRRGEARARTAAGSRERGR